MIKLKRYFKEILVSIFLVVTILAIYSFTEKNPYTTPNTIAKYSYELKQSVTLLDAAANDFKSDKITIDALRKKLETTRLNYKKIEFYLAFHYPEYVKENINGAPLLHLEKEGTRPKVVVPNGLQVLDELIFSKEALEEKIRIAALAKDLKTSYSTLFANLDKNKKGDKYVFKSLQLQLIRVFTLGLTGFDTPGSLNAIPEAEASFIGMREFINENHKNNTNVKPIVTLLDDAIVVLQNSTSFDEFDRLSFFKLYLDPLYKKLGAVDKKSNSEYIANTMAWNPESTSMFSEDFLNPYFFSELNPEEDSDALRNLGETLFYDPLLSDSGTVSCASCHNPEKGFTDGIPKSMSNVQGKTVLRNSPTLLNAVYADRYFYDLRAFTIEQQAEHVIFNKDEFNTGYNAILEKLNKNSNYAKTFNKVFGKSTINRKNFSSALASYIISLKSFNSAFDKYVRSEIKDIAPEVKQGFNLFMGKANCATCHFAPTFSGLVPPFYSESESEILGVLINPTTQKTDSDLGRIDNQVYTEHAWIYEKSFKTTTVRNIALTAPYFHNGAYSTLDEVIDFYNKGGAAGMGLADEVPNQTLSADELNLNNAEVKALIAFMESLTDNPANKY